MAQKAILRFLDQNQGTNGVIRISTGEDIDTHDYIHANDFQGEGSGKSYLLAPFDCVVKAINRTNNQILFESTSAVETACGKVTKVCIAPTHMDDDDFNSIGFYIGKTFSQNDIIYREGMKGQATGNHIHMSQAMGEFKGDSENPTIDLPGATYVYDSKTYTQKIINADNPAFVCDVFFAGSTVQPGQSDTAKAYIWKRPDGTFVNGNGVTVGAVASPPRTTMTLTCTRASMQNGHYPTRPLFDGSYHATDYFLTPGDIIRIKNVKAHGSNVVCQIESVSQPSGSSTIELPRLKDRWFVYDKEYFS